MPVAVIERGTTDTQRVISTVLGELRDAALELEIEPPALLLIGETTELAERYAWFAPENVVLYKNKATGHLARVS